MQSNSELDCKTINLKGMCSQSKKQVLQKTEKEKFNNMNNQKKKKWGTSDSYQVS